MLHCSLQTTFRSLHNVLTKCKYTSTYLGHNTAYRNIKAFGCFTANSRNNDYNNNVSIIYNNCPVVKVCTISLKS